MYQGEDTIEFKPTKTRFLSDGLDKYDAQRRREWQRDPWFVVCTPSEHTPISPRGETLGTWPSRSWRRRPLEGRECASSTLFATHLNSVKGTFDPRLRIRQRLYWHIISPNIRRLKYLTHSVLSWPLLSRDHRSSSSLFAVAAMLHYSSPKEVEMHNNKHTPVRIWPARQSDRPV